jgi:hypothetical protein
VYRQITIPVESLCVSINRASLRHVRQLSTGLSNSGLAIRWVIETFYRVLFTVLLCALLEALQAFSFGSFASIVAEQDPS